MLACSFLISGSAQIQYGGEPFGGPIDPNSTEVPFIEYPRVDTKGLLKADSIKRAAGNKVLRFAKNRSVSIDIKESGKRSRTSDGRTVWRLGIRSVGARSLNFAFRPFDLVKGARIFIYTPDQRKVLGSFTRANRSPGRSLATMPVPGDRAVIELIEPIGGNGNSELVLSRISHAYRDFLNRSIQGNRGYGDAGDCNLNVNCPDGKPWRIQKRAVAMVIDNGNRLCSGALVNNTAEDGTPYFLTAAHCLDNGGPPSGWVFLFNYESPDCVDEPGPTDQSVSGSTLRARHEDSDFALVELVDTPPTAYEVFYAGWDHSGNTPDSSVCIHHPNGDIKKIAFDDDQPDSAQFNTSIPNGEWNVKEWDRNTTTETGSSGSPLFDEEGKIIGQLHGGDATCQNNVNDYFGRFSISWDYHTPNDSQLKHWLDPLDTNVSRWQGHDPLVGDHPYDAALTSLLVSGTVLCNDGSFSAKAEFRNLGGQSLDSLELYLLLEGDTIEKKTWKGKLDPGRYDTLAFSTHTLQDTGKGQLTGGVRSPNGKTDQDPSNDQATRTFSFRTKAQVLEMDLQTDCYGSETSWELVEKEGTDTLYQREEGYYAGRSGSPNEGGQETLHEFCLVEGCYELHLHDSYGDGMNGGQYPECNVDGELSIRSMEGEKLVELGQPDFGSDTLLSFCTDSVRSPSPPEEDLMQVVPNPAPGWIRVRIEGEPGKYRLRIYDMTGRKVFFRKIVLDAYRFDRKILLSTLSSGLYLVEIEGALGRYRRKLLIDR